MQNIKSPPFNMFIHVNSNPSLLQDESYESQLAKEMVKCFLLVVVLCI